MIDKEFRVVRKNYAVTLGKTHFSVEAYGTYFFTFSPISAVPCGNMEDIDDAESMSFQISEKEENTVAVWMTSSNLWRRKEYILKIEPEGFHYSVRVFGTGSPRDIHYFSGTVIGGKQGAVYETSEYMLTQPHIGIENHYFSMAEDNKISMQLMVPPPLCFPFRTENSQAWFGIGLVADAGCYHFDGFSYRNIQNRAHFSVDLYGAQKVDGEWKAPGIFGCPGKDEWEVLREYAAWHFRSGCHKTEVFPAPWWYGPFFCGWGEQAILKWKYHTDIYGAASEAAYTEMSEHLDALDLHPTAMIIDDKWQEKYGTFLPDPVKWPNLRRFTDREHAKGRHVLLWYRCWSAEGLPVDECILQDGKPLAGDPTNPRYIERVKHTVHTLLSEESGCFGCDGFKIDFADQVPTGEDLVTWESGVYGIELVKRLIALIYHAAKEVKSDALISCSGCHPYFADVTDMARLHDYDLRLRSVERCMSFRAKLYRIMLPDVLIDTDFPAFAGYHDSMKYLRIAPSLGVPDLYRLSDTGECRFEKRDWEEIRMIWNGYTKNILNKIKNNP